MPDPTVTTPPKCFIADLPTHGRDKKKFKYTPIVGDKFWDKPLALGEVIRVHWDAGGKGNILIIHNLAIKIHCHM
jgi:hypothetical protein